MEWTEAMIKQSGAWQQFIHIFDRDDDSSDIVDKWRAHPVIWAFKVEAMMSWMQFSHRPLDLNSAPSPKPLSGLSCYALWRCFTNMDGGDGKLGGTYALFQSPGITGVVSPNREEPLKTAVKGQRIEHDQWIRNIMWRQTELQAFGSVGLHTSVREAENLSSAATLQIWRSHGEGDVLVGLNLAVMLKWARSNCRPAVCWRCRIDKVKPGNVCSEF